MSITDRSVPMEYPAYIIERSTPDLGCLQCHTPGRQADWQKLNSGTAIQVSAKFLSFLTQNTHNAACDKPTVTERGRYQRKKREMKVFPTYHETEERAPVHTWQRWSLKSRWERRTGSAFIHIHAIHGVVIHFPRPRRNLRTSSQVRMCEFCWWSIYTVRV